MAPRPVGYVLFDMDGLLMCVSDLSEYWWILIEKKNWPWGDPETRSESTPKWPVCEPIHKSHIIIAVTDAILEPYGYELTWDVKAGLMGLRK